MIDLQDIELARHLGQQHQREFDRRVYVALLKQGQPKDQMVPAMKAFADDLRVEDLLASNLATITRAQQRALIRVYHLRTRG